MTDTISPAQRAEALEGSIKHWRDLERNPVFSTDIDCALCALYFNNWCIGCPIMERTGHESCADTPYPSYIKAVKRGRPVLASYYAGRMREFLESLRSPTTEQQT